MSVTVISTEKAPAAVGPYSQAIRIAQMFPAGEGNMIYSSGQLGLDPATGKMVTGDFEAEVRQAFANLEAIVTEAGSTLGNAVKLTLFLTDLSQFATVNAIMKELVPEPFPARTTIGVAALPLGATFEIEGIFAA
ncbi:MAG: Rid family detoxifying hydrolase [Burkholderiaceae bacterium]